MHTDMQLEEELSFMERYNLTPDELLFIKMVFLAREGSEGKDIVKRYFALPENVRMNAISLLTILQNKQIITKEYKIPSVGGIFKPHEVIFNKNFEKALFRNSFDMGKELFECYPLSTVINGVEYKLRRVSKKFGSLEQAFFHYGKYINWNKDRHNKILDLIEAGKRTGYQFSTLDAFIVDNDWVNLEALKDSGQLISNMRMI